MASTITVESTEAAGRIDRWLQDLPVGRRHALRDIGVAILVKELQQVPEDPETKTGHQLRGSLFPPRINEAATVVEVGSEGCAYAVAQHENLEYHHPKPGAKAKFVEDPVREVTSIEGLAMVEQAMREAVFRE